MYEISIRDKTHKHCLPYNSEKPCPYNLELDATMVDSNVFKCAVPGLTCASGEVKYMIGTQIKCMPAGYECPTYFLQKEFEVESDYFIPSCQRDPDDTCVKRDGEYCVLCKRGLFMYEFNCTEECKAGTWAELGADGGWFCTSKEREDSPEDKTSCDDTSYLMLQPLNTTVPNSSEESIPNPP